MSNPFSKLGQISYRAKVGKSCLRRILLRFLKFRCSLKKSLLLKPPLIYRFLRQISFSNLAELFIIARKLEIITGLQQNLKWAAGRTSLFQSKALYATNCAFTKHLFAQKHYSFFIFRFSQLYLSVYTEYCDA